MAAAAASSLAFAELETWASSTRKLLALEREAEIAAVFATVTDEGFASGASLAGLRISDVTTGLFGRRVLEASDVLGRGLPAHDISVGDTVGVYSLGSTRARPAPSPSALAGAATEVLKRFYDAQGIVTRVTDTYIQVAFEESPPAATGRGKDADDDGAPSPLVEGARVRLDKLADDVSYRRLLQAVDDLAAYRHGPASKLVRCLFGDPRKRDDSGADASCLPSFEEAAAPDAAAAAARPPLGSKSKTALPPLSAAGLNAGQIAAVDAALRARDLAVIHGPPGTGKTTCVVEYIAREVARGSKVLATAPSNVAVDNLVTRLAARGLSVVRLGHPARLTPETLAHSLDALVAAADGTDIVKDVRKELATASAQAASAPRAAERREARAAERALRSELRSRQEAVVAEILRGADVVLATCTGAATKVLRKALTITQPGGPAIGPIGGGGGKDAAPPPPGPSVFRGFDVVVVDEAAQAMEAAAWIPLLMGSKAVLAGDHLQLPPTVLSEEAGRAGLAVTLLDRVVGRYGGGGGGGGAHSSDAARILHTSTPVVHMLTVQYRMHSDIMGWASGALYGGALVAAPEVAARRLAQLPGVALPEGGEVTVTAATLRRARDAAQEAAAAGASPPPPEAPAPAPAHGKGGSSTAGKPTVPMLAPFAATALASHLGSSTPSAPDLTIEASTLNAPFLLLDTAGCDMGEASGPAPGGPRAANAALASGSKANVGEADVVLKHVLALLAAGLRPEHIAVVTPYNGQVGLLRALLGGAAPGVEVRSVDGFQGQEKEAIVISCVRSNVRREIGFLSDARRFNVAVTRAKRHVAIVGDSDTLTGDAFLAGLVGWAEAHGLVLSAAEYTLGDEPLVVGSSGATGGNGSGPAKADRGAAAAAAQAKAAKAAAKAAAVAAADAADKRAAVDASISVLCRFLAAVDAATGPRGQGVTSLAGASVAAAAPTSGPARHAAALNATIAFDGDVPRLCFGASLSSFQRAMLHATAEHLGLPHASADVAEEGGKEAGVSNAKPKRMLTVTYVPPERRREAAVTEGSSSSSGGVGGAGGELTPSPTLARLTAALMETPLAADNEGQEGKAGEESDGSSASDEEGSEGEASGRGPTAPHPSGLNMRERQKAARKAAREAERAAKEAARAAEAAAVAAVAPAPAPLCTSAASAPPPGPNNALGKSASLLGSLHAERQARAAAAAAVSPPPAATKPAAAAAAASSSPGGHKLGAGSQALGVGVKALPEVGGGGSGSSKGSKKGGKKSGAAAADDDDDEMALLDAVVAQSKSCAAAKCKESTATTGTTCRFCHLRFCYSHGLPEVHGCGDSASAAARAAWLGGGTAAVGLSASTGPVLKGAKRAAVSRELQKKIDEAAAGRSGGGGNGSGKKGGKK